jgi:hypothetical protein
MLLVPWEAVAVAMAISLITLGFTFLVLRYRGWKLQFSLRILLLMGFMVAWPISRYAFEVGVERKRIRSQQECAAMAMNLKPPTSKIMMSGRYNDGHSDYVIQSWIIQLLAKGIDFNQIQFEAMTIVALDLTGTNITDDQLAAVVNTQTVQELNLTSTKITDAGLECLHELRSLKSLTLTNTQVSQQIIESLKVRFPELVVVR